MRRWMNSVSILLILFPASLCYGEELPEVGARPPWNLLAESDDSKSGYVLHRRKTADSDASTFRLEAIVDSTPELAARAATRVISDPELSPENTDTEVLRREADTIVVYSYIHINAPFVSDRDVISKIERSHDVDTESYRIEWKAVDEEGPPKKDGVIRLDRSEGYWSFTPEGNGTTRAVYVSHTEVDGYIPGWVIDSQMSKTMVGGIESLRKAVDLERTGSH
jgi:hypothetical protein